MSCICGVIGVGAQHSAACMMNNRFQGLLNHEELKSRLAAVEAERDRLAYNENVVRGHLLDTCRRENAERERAERAESALARAREVLREVVSRCAACDGRGWVMWPSEDHQRECFACAPARDALKAALEET